MRQHGTYSAGRGQRTPNAPPVRPESPQSPRSSPLKRILVTIGRCVKPIVPQNVAPCRSDRPTPASAGISDETLNRLRLKFGVWGRIGLRMIQIPCHGRIVNA